MPAVFSRQFLRSLVNTSASDAAMLHSAAKRCTDRLTAYVARSPDAQLQIAVAVALQRYGGLGFDRLSKTKTTAKLLQVPPGRLTSLMTHPAIEPSHHALDLV